MLVVRKAQVHNTTVDVYLPASLEAWSPGPALGPPWLYVLSVDRREALAINVTRTAEYLYINTMTLWTVSKELSGIHKFL